MIKGIKTFFVDFWPLLVIGALIAVAGGVIGGLVRVAVTSG